MASKMAESAPVNAEPERTNPDADMAFTSPAFLGMVLFVLPLWLCVLLPLAVMSLLFNYARSLFAAKKESAPPPPPLTVKV